MAGLIGNIGGLSGADFSPYQRDLERRQQMIIADMQRRQAEAQLALEDKLGMKNLDARLAELKSGDERSKREHDQRMSEELGRSERHASDQQFAKDSAAEGEKREIRKEDRATARKKKDREDEVTQEEEDFQRDEGRRKEAAERAGRVSAAVAEATSGIDLSSTDVATSLNAVISKLRDNQSLSADEKGMAMAQARDALIGLQGAAAARADLEEKIRTGEVKGEHARIELNKIAGEEMYAKALADPDSVPHQLREDVKRIQEAKDDLADKQREKGILESEAGLLAARSNVPVVGGGQDTVADVNQAMGPEGDFGGVIVGGGRLMQIAARLATLEGEIEEKSALIQAMQYNLGAMANRLGVIRD